MRTRKVLFAVYTLTLALLIFPACKAKSTADKLQSKPLATVNGVAITEDDLYLRLGGGHAGAVTPEMRKQTLDEAINQELLYQQGLKLGLDKDFKYRNAVRILEQRLKQFKRAEMSRRVMSTQIAATVNVSEDDVTKYIDSHRADLMTEYHIYMIRFPGQSEAQAAAAEIGKGRTFEEIARANNPYAPKTGKKQWDLGYLQWIQIPGEWREPLEKMQKGDVSDVIQGQKLGFVLIELIDKKMLPENQLERMRAGIMMRLRDEKVAAAYDAYMEKLRKESKISINGEGGKSLDK